MAAIAATALFALNPNLLYIQSTPMTEGLFLGCFDALLYFTVRFRETQAWWAVPAPALRLRWHAYRYDGWFLIPFVGLYFLWAARERRFRVALVFCRLASLGPLYLAGAQLGHERTIRWTSIAARIRRSPYRAAPVIPARGIGRARSISSDSTLVLRRAVPRGPGDNRHRRGGGEARLLAAHSAAAPARLLLCSACIPEARRFSCRCCIPAPTTTCATDCLSCRCWR